MAYLISDQKGIHLFIYFVSITGMISLGLQHLLGKVFHRQKKNRKYNQIIFLKDDKQFWMLWRWCSGDTGIGKRRRKVLEDLSPTEGQKLPEHNLLGGHLLEQPQLVALCFK